MSGRHTPVRSRGAAGLAWRQFAADPWVSAALALLVALVSLVATLVPRALDDTRSRQLDEQVGALSALQRDVTGRWVTTAEMYAVPESVEQTWGDFVEGAERIRSSQPEPLRSLLQPGQLLVEQTRVDSSAPPIESGFWAVDVTPAVDPALQEHVDLVEGEWPVVPDPADGEGDASGDEPTGKPVDLSELRAQPTQVMVLASSAERLHWKVGDVVGGAGTLQVVGTYEPKDPDDPRWQHVDNAVSLGVLVSPAKGESAQTIVFMAPESTGSPQGGDPTAVRMTVWYPVDPTQVEGREAAGIRSQLTGMLAQQLTIAEAEDGTEASVWPSRSAQMPAFESELGETLGEVVSAGRATSSLLAVVAAGPLGVALAMTALAARLVVQRRRPALAMTLARGASPTQLRRLVALEGVALGVPAAVLGHLAGRALVPGPGTWWEWPVTAVVALVPAAALALSLDDASLLEQRRDLGGQGARRRVNRGRVVAEVAVVALAALATWRLLDRGTRGDDPSSSGIDLLAALTPALLALAACVVALRLYPLPLAALTRGLHGRRGLTPFLGAARALRDPAGGLVPVLAVVLGTAIALVSAVLLTTVDRGGETAAWSATGAAVRVTGPPVTDEVVTALEHVDGVAAVARVRPLGTTSELVRERARTTAQLLIADRSLQDVLAASPDVVGPSPALFADGGDIPVLTGGAVDLSAGAATLASLPGRQVQVVGHLDTLPGVRTPGAWVLVDADRWQEAGKTVPMASLALVATDPGADVEAVAAAVQEQLPTGAVVTVEEQLAEVTSAPVATGLRQAFVGATLLTALLTVLSVVVVQLMGAAGRARLLAVLRTLGLAPRQTRALTAWELGPLLVTALVVGALLGLLVPWLLIQALDLTALTGGRTQPALHIDPLVVGGVLLGVVLTVLAAVTLSAWLAGRTNLAQALRVGEER